MNFKKGSIFLSLMLFLSFSIGAAEFSDGQLRLVLHEDSGRFSLYFLPGDNSKPQALFSDEDPRTSFLSVMVNDRSYKMGDASGFRTRLGGDKLNPSFIFESAFMIVTEDFSFVKGVNSALTNGVKILITLENRGDRQVSAGARFLLDTKLGEGMSGFPFTTNRRTINSETLLTRIDGDRYWTDRNDKLSLSGSFITGLPTDPDSIHMANWKKLNDVTWKAAYQAGKNFNYTPYSIGDTAVCYYYEPRALGRGEKVSFEFILTFNDETSDFTSADFPPVAAGGESILDLQTPGTADSREQDLAVLEALIAQIETRIAAGTATEEEMASFEFTLNKLRAKYRTDDNMRQAP